MRWMAQTSAGKVLNYDRFSRPGEAHRLDTWQRNSNYTCLTLKINEYIPNEQASSVQAIV
jgi:hypothetical protein